MTETDLRVFAGHPFLYPVVLPDRWLLHFHPSLRELKIIPAFIPRTPAKYTHEGWKWFTHHSQIVKAMFAANLRPPCPGTCTETANLAPLKAFVADLDIDMKEWERFKCNTMK